MREKIAALVGGIRPFDPLEADHVTRALEWIESGAELFRTHPPATPPVHLVCYFPLIDQCSGKILLVNHVKAGKWLPAGGHVEPEEDPRDTVVREAREELGLAANLFREDPAFITVTETVGDTRHTDVTLWFPVQCSVQENLRPDMSEFRAVRWFSFAELIEMEVHHLDPHLHRFLRKWLSSGRTGGSVREGRV